MKLIQLSIILFFVFSLFFTSCKPNDSATVANGIPLMVDTMLSKVIIPPEELTPLKAIVRTRPATKEQNSSKIKIVSIVDGNCRSCIMYQLNAVDSIFQSQLNNPEIFEMIFILNVKSSDSTFFVLNQLPLINVRGSVYWDNKYLFERTNKLFTSDVNLRTFMTNHSGQIVQYGNPTINPKVINEYRIKLTQLIH